VRNTAAFAGFPSVVGKSVLWTFPRSGFFHSSLTHRLCYRAKKEIVAHYVEESGVMNVFCVFRDQVVPPALTGTILAGITRDSVIILLCG
jgi:hypothetical protein